MKFAIILAVASGLVGWPALALADPDKDESGKSRRYSYERHDDRSGRYREAVRIPRGHLPPPGECRDWYVGRPPGHQPPPHRCCAGPDAA
jgi:hypothetical protein